MSTQPLKPINNLRELLEQRAGDTPEKHFLFSEADGRQFSYAEFDAAVNRTASALAFARNPKGRRCQPLNAKQRRIYHGIFCLLETGRFGRPG